MKDSINKNNAQSLQIVLADVKDGVGSSLRMRGSTTSTNGRSFWLLRHLVLFPKMQAGSGKL
eukprot:1759235-Amphidinium_carterae.1